MSQVFEEAVDMYENLIENAVGHLNIVDHLVVPVDEWMNDYLMWRGRQVLQEFIREETKCWRAIVHKVLSHLTPDLALLCAQYLTVARWGKNRPRKNTAMWL